MLSTSTCVLHLSRRPSIDVSWSWCGGLRMLSTAGSDLRVCGCRAVALTGNAERITDRAGGYLFNQSLGGRLGVAAGVWLPAADRPWYRPEQAAGKAGHAGRHACPDLRKSLRIRFSVWSQVDQRSTWGRPSIASNSSID